MKPKKQKNLRLGVREMNGLSHLEPDYSEFVEVDPTGRYGRVSNQLSLFLNSIYLSVSLNSVICLEIGPKWVFGLVAVQ